MFCMRCGAALPEGAKFCTVCGQPAGAPPARAAAPAASPADLCAWQFYSTRMSAALAKMKQFFFLREMEGADGAQAQVFAEACVQRALANYPGLPRGFQNGVVIYPVLCQQRATPGALEYVRALPKNHFAAFACPMLFEYATGNLYYGTELPVWGFAMVGGIRKAGAALLKP